MNDIKALSYGMSPLMLEVKINKTTDITEIVENIGTISNSLDYPNLTRYRVNSVPITLTDERGFFAPNNSENWFRSDGRDLPQNGHGVEIQINVGFNDGDKKLRKVLFKGRITKIVQDSVAATTTITADSLLQKMFSEVITDFGLQKQFRIDASNEESLNGVYPISDWVLPISEDSSEVKKDINKPLTEVPELATRGHLDSDNYVITDSGIETEGGDVMGAESGYPQIKFKAPYRYRDVERLIDDVLEKIDISNSSIDLPEIDVGGHFSSSGRVGYPVIGAAPFGSSEPISWEGYTTDFIYDDGKFYFLRNPRRAGAALASLIEYDTEKDTSRVLWRASSSTQFKTEFWKLAISGNYIAILASDTIVRFSKEFDLPEIPAFEPRSYDSSLENSQTYILFYDIVNDSVSTRVGKTSEAFPPQVGHYYIFGQTYGDYRTLNILTSVVPQKPPFVLPDTRRSFLFHGGELYYVFANNLNVGVAKVGLTTPTSSVVSVDRDKRNNHLGLDFDIHNSKLYCCGTFKESDKSKIFAFEVNL